MVRFSVRFSCAFLLISGLVCAQSTLNFKTRRIDTRSGSIAEIESPILFTGGHLLVQFETQPSPAIIATLKQRGISVLQDVPDNGLLISLDRPASLRGIGVRYAARIEPSDKISSLVTAAGDVLVEFHPDVDMNAARAMVLAAGSTLSENPDLNPHHLLIHTTDVSQLGQLSMRDEVAYIFPASDDLVKGVPTLACLGAVTLNGATAQSIPTYGAGWDGPGLGSAVVGYVFSHITSQLDSSAVEAEILRAMAEWSKAVKVTWTPGSSATAPQTVNILFASGDHGDGYPFDGPGGVLAHTFYPSPPNPEPIAGDMHFDDSETWHIGANTDVFSVALHELGHALGLGHADSPTAVMYPYYKMSTALSALDISTVQTLYAAQTAGAPTPTPTPTPAPAPLTLLVNATAATTTASTVNLSGTAAGGAGAIVVTWSAGASTGTAQGSTAWSIANVPLAVGANTITIVATNGANHVSQSVSITRTAQSTPTPTPPSNPVVPVTPSGPDTTPPSLTINSPASTSVSTSAASIVFSGSSSDNVGVKTVTWSTNTGGAGTATGTTQWSATIPLLVGSNSVTIRAADAAGNVGWRSVVVTRH